MTDERLGDALWSTIERLPRGSGIVFRHYGLALDERRALFALVMAVARRRRLTVVVAGGERLGRGQAGSHGRARRRTNGIMTWPAHDRREVIAGMRAGADLIFISPVLPTASHPGGRSLGWRRAAMLARLTNGRAIALGGLQRSDIGRVRRAGFFGWAAIDGLSA